MTVGCAHVNEWFDRSVCPEPCGSMHNYCIDCGRLMDWCPNVAEQDAPRSFLDRCRDAWQAFVA